MSILYAIIGIPLVLALLSQTSKRMTRWLSQKWIRQIGHWAIGLMQFPSSFCLQLSPKSPPPCAKEEGAKGSGRGKFGGNGGEGEKA
jgi:hypothetical protein